MKNTSFKPYMIAGTIAGVLLYKYHHILLGKNYKKRLVNNILSTRFETKYLPYHHLLSDSYNNQALGSMSPRNIYDIQKLFQISNQYTIPIINDINYYQRIIPYQHIKLDMNNYNQVLHFNNKEGRIKVQSGMKINDLMNYLELHGNGYTIKQLEHLRHSSLSLQDVLFNHFYSFHNGKYLDENIDEYTLIVPKGEKLLLVKPAIDFSFNHINFGNMFFYSNNVLGILLDLDIKLDKRQDDDLLIKVTHHSFKNKNIQETIKDIYGNLAEDPLINDAIIVSNDLKGYDIYLRIPIKNFARKTAELSNNNLGYSLISQDEAYELFKGINDYDNTLFLRKIKIKIPQNNETQFLSKLHTLLNKTDNNILLNPSIVFSPKYNQITISLPNTNEDIELLETSLFFLKNIHKLIRKSNTNLYLNTNITLNPKYTLMQEIGFNNYHINEDIKYYFDPQYILNPHLSIHKPIFIERLKRQSKFINYILTKMKI